MLEQTVKLATEQLEKISQVDLYIGNEELEEVTSCFTNRWLTEGPKTKQFQEELQTFLGSNHVTFAPNGTLGLLLGLLALDLPKGGEVIVPSFTFYASATSIIFANLVPVFVDVDEETFNVCPEKIKAAITEKTVAIMPVHIYGQTCNISAIMEIARKHDLKVIEDAAQAFGLMHKDRPAGCWGDIGVYSFFSDKTITTGEGAALVVKDPKLYEKVRYLRNQGRLHSGTFIHSELGMNFRITDMQSAIGLVQFKKMPDIIKRRKQLWALYEAGLTGVGDLSFMKIDEHSSLIPFRFYIKTKQKDQLIDFLEANSIQTRSFFYPMHLQPKLKQYARGSLPIAEKLYAEGMCLPIHHHISFEDVNRIIQTIKRFFR